MAEPAVVTETHGRHDPLLIAASADRPRDRGPLPTLVKALLAACTECSRLQGDILALAAALPTTATPRRTRDFTLTAADAERLRRGGPRAWLARLGSARDTITRPLALGLTTLGLVGLLVATVPGVLPVGSAGASATAGPSTEIETLVKPSAGGALGQAAPPGTGDAPRPVDGSAETAATTAPDPAPVVILSGAFLAGGLGLFALRRLGRREAMR